MLGEVLCIRGNERQIVLEGSGGDNGICVLQSHAARSPGTDGTATLGPAAQASDRMLCAADDAFDVLIQLTPANLEAIWQRMVATGFDEEPQIRYRPLPFGPRRLDAVILSHAHIDHSGRLPLLVRHGFHGPIYATPATRDLCAVMLTDSAEIQEKDAAFLARRGRGSELSEPLYSVADAIAVQDLILGVPYRRLQFARRHRSFQFTEAGHILGSASVDVRITENGRPTVSSSRATSAGPVSRHNASLLPA